MRLTDRAISQIGIVGLAMVVVTGLKTLLSLFLGHTPDLVNLWVTAGAYGSGVALVFWSFTGRGR